MSQEEKLNLWRRWSFLTGFIAFLMVFFTLSSSNLLVRLGIANCAGFLASIIMNAGAYLGLQLQKHLDYRNTRNDW